MPTARRSAAAERDLQDIAHHIALEDGRPIAADRVIDTLVGQAEEIARLSTSTIMGTAAPEIGDGVRLFCCKRWGILFRYQPHGIDVLRFADGSQDYFSWKLG